MSAGDDAVGADRQLVDLVGAQREEVVHRLVVVGEVFLDVQSAEVELQRFARLQLQVEGDAVAFAGLLEPRGVDEVGHLRTGGHTGHILEGGRRHIAEDLRALAIDLFLVVLRGDRDTPRLGGVLPAVQPGDARLLLFGLVVVIERAGAGQSVGFQVQRLARVHEHGAAQASFGQVRFGRFIDLDAADDLRRDLGLVEAAIGLLAEQPDGLRHRVAVEERQVEAGIGAVDADALALAEAAIDRYAGDLRHRLGYVRVRELADVLSAHRFDDGVGRALGLQRFEQTAANAGDDDLFDLVRRSIAPPARGPPLRTMRA